MNESHMNDARAHTIVIEPARARSAVATIGTRNATARMMSTAETRAETGHGQEAR